MAVGSLKGIVIREMPVGESNKQIVVLAKEQGKLLLSAKGARNPKSKLLAGTQLFSFCEFQIFEGKGFISISQADILESFYEIRNDIVRLAYATYLLELVEKTVLPGMEADEILELLLKTLIVLCKTDIDVKLATRIFEIKLLQLLGLMSDVDRCIICGEVDKNRLNYIDILQGNIICNACGKLHNYKKISTGCYKALEFVVSHEIKDIYKFRVSEEVLEDLTKTTREYISVHIDEKFNTLDFAESL